MSINHSTINLTGVGTHIPYIDIVRAGDDQGLIFNRQISTGYPGNPQKAIFGSGGSYAVGLEDDLPTGTPKPGSAWHCTVTNTSGTTITSATDITTTLASDGGSTVGLFNGTSTGNYILIGSDYQFGGVKVKITASGVVESTNVTGEFLSTDTPLWLPSTYMATKADYPYTQYGNSITTISGSEQWRFGSDPRQLPLPWVKVALNINGTDYTKYWARFRITSDITTDPTIEQLKIHTDSVKINGDGVVEFFGIARPIRTLVANINNLISNNIHTPSNQPVTYHTSECVVDKRNNKLSDNAIDTTILVQHIDTGIDTSIPLLLDISYYVDSTNTGDIEWQIDVYDVADGFVFNSTPTPRNYKTIDTVSTNSLNTRRTVSLLVPINTLTNEDNAVIVIKRDATHDNTNDTLEANTVITNVKLSGAYWRL